MIPVRKHLPSDAMEELEALVDEHVEKAAWKLSREQAVADVLKARPELYERCEAFRLAGRQARPERSREDLTPRELTRKQLLERMQARAQVAVAKRANETPEQHLTRYLSTPEGAQWYELMAKA
jgi:hypothetical protein